MNHHLVHQKNKVPVFVLANVLQLGPGIDSFSIGKSYLKNLSFGNLDFHNVIKKGNSCILMFVLVDWRLCCSLRDFYSITELTQ